MNAIPFEVNDARIRHDFLNRLFPDAITGLKEETAAQWGKMTAQHMIEHLIWAFKLSTGSAKVICSTPPNLIQRTKRFLYNNNPTPRGFRNPVLNESPAPLQFNSLSRAKHVLHEELLLFFDHFQKSPDAIHVHPIFGPLGSEEWERTHFKHSYHHLLQFGLVMETGSEA